MSILSTNSWWFSDENSLIIKSDFELIEHDIFAFKGDTSMEAQ